MSTMWPGGPDPGVIAMQMQAAAEERRRRVAFLLLLTRPSGRSGMVDPRPADAINTKATP